MKRLLIPLFSIALWWSAAAQDKAQSDGGWCPVLKKVYSD